jgi:hypothetical protein
MQRFAHALVIIFACVIATQGITVQSARADSRHRRPPIVRVAQYGPNYRVPYHRYFGPTSGTYGAISFSVPNRFYYPVMPPFYAGMGYGYGSAGAYGYWPPAYGTPYMVAPPPVARYSDSDPVLSNPVLRGTLLENELRWGSSLPPAMSPRRLKARFRPSTPEQRMKSIHAEAQGDVWMHKLKALNAYERYKYAITIAADRPEPYFKVGFSLAAVGNFDSAVKYFKQGLDLNPSWPASAERLDAIFGDGNRLSVLTLIERVGQWVHEDIRDPDRLFLMGVVLYFDGDDRATPFFDAAYRLAGSGDHLLAFLQPAPNMNGNNRNPSFTAPGSGVAPPSPMEPPIPLDSPPAAPAPNAGPGPNGWDPNNRGPALSPRYGSPNLPNEPNTVAPPNVGPPYIGQPNFGQPRVGQPRVAPSPSAPPTVVPANPSSPNLSVPSGKSPFPAAPRTPVPSISPSPPPAIVPPLPAPSNPESDSESQSESPATGGPVLAPPSQGGDSTAQSR